MLRQVLASALAVAALAGTAQAGQIGIGGFSGSENVTTFDGLGLPFTSATPRVIGGNTYTTDSGQLRYANTFEANCSNECIGNDSDLGYIDVKLGSVQNRVGARVGGNAVSYAGFVDFFDAADNLLGSVEYGDETALVFIGWEDLSVGIARMRLRDTAANGRIVHMDDFRFETATAVSAPGTVALVGLGLFGLAMLRRRRA